jgi:RNA polymerase sigma-70 factor (ECF subfamily)
MGETYTTRAQDTERFVVLLTESQREILRYIRTFVPNADEAQDLLQETALALWRRFERYDPNQPFVPWACRFAFRHVLKYRERKSRQRRFLSIEALEQLAVDRVEHDDLLESRRHALTNCLQRLSEGERLLIQQRYASPTNMTELAKASGRSIFTLYKALERVRRRLHECVNRNVRHEGRI